MSAKHEQGHEQGHEHEEQFFKGLPGGVAGAAVSDEAVGVSRGTRVVVNVFGLVAAVAMAWLFRADAAYYLQDAKPLALGSTTEMIFGQELPHNRYVSVSGIPDPRVASGSAMGRDYHYFLLMGSWIFVQKDVTGKTGGTPIGEGEYEMFSGAGRLIAIESDSRYKPIKDFLVTTLGYSAPKRTYLLLDGEVPRSGYRVPLVFGLAVFVFLLNVRGIVRNLRSARR